MTALTPATKRERPPMHTIAIVSRKGGAGKTTIAVHLAAAAERAGHRTAILDLDPQASAKGWADIRSAPRPEVHICLPHRLSNGLADVAHCDLAIIDTAPHAESGAFAAARAANLVLIPCRPAIFDLHAGAATARAATASTGCARTPIRVRAGPPRPPSASCFPQGRSSAPSR